MTELKPCPFCGGEAEMLTAESMHGGYLFGIMCNDCRSRGDVYNTEAEAAEAWNTRADYHGFEQAAIDAWQSIKAWNTRHVETCKDLGGTGANGEQVFNCSECGCVLSLYDRDGTNTLCTGFIYDYPRYCPACGAKVVDE